VLFVLFSYPWTHVFAATSSIPAIGNVGYTDVSGTIDTDTIAGADAGSGSTNIAILSLETEGTSLTINACGLLLVGEIKLEGTGLSRAYISLQPATAYVCPATGTADSGKIVVGAPIYIKDEDSDTYPENTTLYSSPGTGLQRLYTMNASWKTTQDCNDSSASYLANLTCYPDEDNDTYYSTVSHSVCAGSTCASIGESATVGTDCCDTSEDAKPGQTTFFTTALTNSTNCPVTTADDYDYNCDDSETLDSTGINGSTYACTNPCSGCDLDYSVTAGWLTAPPSTCGGSGTKYTMSGSYVSGTCYTVASCATLATSASSQRGCR